LGFGCAKPIRYTSFDQDALEVSMKTIVGPLKARLSAIVTTGLFVLACSPLTGAISAGATCSSGPISQESSDAGDVTIVVTPRAQSKKEVEAAAQLSADDFVVKENGRPQKIVSAKPAAGSAPVVEVLIQDNLRGRIDDEMKGLRTFIQELPPGSLVLTGYLTSGTLDVRQDFTTDLNAAAASLRVLTHRAPYDPYIEVMEALKRFESQPQRPRIIVLVSDGLDLSRGRDNANPENSIDLNRAIREAQQRGVSVFSFFEPTSEPGAAERLDVTFGQGSLEMISEQTGGDSFLGPTDVVSLAPYLAQMKDELARQWLVTFQSTATGKGLRKLQVTAEKNVHLAYPRGYLPK
jgi:VWFA-related protein